jgi:TonB family protein
MDRLQKKCLFASTGTHVFLACLLVFGSAFFVPSQKPVDTSKMSKLTMIPGKLVDDLLSGGGGNPNIKDTGERIKGETTRTVEPPAPKPEPPAPKPVEAKPTPPAPKPQVTPPPTVKPLPLVPVVRNPGKDQAKVTPKDPKDSDILKNLKPATLTAAEKARQKAEAEAKELAAADAKRREAIAKAFNSATSGLRAGFTDGTAIEVHGQGGEAYANYAQFVREVYENAWLVPTDFLDENETTKVSIVIDRSGNVLSSKIEKNSGNRSLDRSVQRALDSVKFVAPFPPESKDQKRTFTINFNLKSKLLG